VRVSHCNLCGATDFTLLIKKDGWGIVQCRECSLVFVGNPPSDEERAKLYSFDAGYHQDLASDAEREKWHQHEAERNFRTLSEHVRQGRLLDIGCSTGLFLRLATGAGWPARGLEYSPDSANVARTQHNLEVDCGEMTPTRYPEGAFDVVTLWDVVEHLPDPNGAIGMISRIVADGGILILKTPNADGLFPQVSRYFVKLLGFWRHPEPPEHLFQFSEKTLRRMTEAHGFEVLKVQHSRIPITYSFGKYPDWFRSVKWLAYCLMFSPFALIGPWVGRGDDIALIARRKAGETGHKARSDAI
jgi:2-polyprenyl-3-methyl-5-hydroxy-6-metoxy-1,4-benzoquinol methylase